MTFRSLQTCAHFGLLATLCVGLSLSPLTVAAQGQPAPASDPAAAPTAKDAAGKDAPADDAASKEQIDIARDAYNQGLEKLSVKKFKEALVLFKQADAIITLTSVRARVAEALVGLGRLVEARKVARSVADIPPREDESEALVDARKGAAKLAEELDGRIPKFIFKVLSQMSTTRVVVDDKQVSPQNYGGYDVDPGAHTVRVMRQGEDPTTTMVTLAAGQSKTIDLAPAAVVMPEPVLVPAAGEGDGSGPVFGPVAWTGIGLAGAGLIVGTVAGVITLGRSGDIADGCLDGDVGTLCSQEEHDKTEDALLSAHVSTAGFVVMGAGVGVGLLGMFLLDSDDEGSDGQVRVTPLLGPGFAGVRGTF